MANWLASRGLRQDAAGCGARQRKFPTGGAAYGIPRNSCPFEVLTPRTGPRSVKTTGCAGPPPASLAPRASTVLEADDGGSFAPPHAASTQSRPPIAHVTRLVLIATLPFARAVRRLSKFRSECGARSLRKRSHYAIGNLFPLSRPGITRSGEDVTRSRRDAKDPNLSNSALEVSLGRVGEDRASESRL